LERITIIGTGVVGVSMGLALKRANLRNTEIVGSSGDRDALKIAFKAGAYDEETPNLRNAVRGAQMIVLDSPFTQTREILDAIAPIVEDGCVITDTCTAKVKAMEWADQLLPSNVSFVGGRPLIRKPFTKLEDASADLFQGSKYCISPAKNADQPLSRRSSAWSNSSARSHSSSTRTSTTATQWRWRSCPQCFPPHS
jgi:prephenate dehydrogenase